MNTIITKKSHAAGVAQLRKEFAVDPQPIPAPSETKIRQRCLMRGCRGLLKQCDNPKQHLSKEMRTEWEHRVSECERCGVHTHFTPAAFAGRA